MTHQAHVEQDWLARGVRLQFRVTDESGYVRETLRFAEQPQRVMLDGTTERDEFGVRPVDTGLTIPEEYARALYEALADHFGHSGHDVRALRRDYDAERARVDRLIAVVTDKDRPRLIVADRVRDDGTGGGFTA